MKKSNIIIFSVAFVLLMFANIKVTLFDNTDAQIEIQLNNERAMASETDYLFEMPPEDGNGGGQPDMWEGECLYCPQSIITDIWQIQIKCKDGGVNECDLSGICTYGGC